MSFLGTTHIDRALTEVSVLYANDAKSYIAKEVAPIVNVQHETDSYFVYSRAHYRENDVLRANGALANEIDFYFSTASYRTDEYAVRMIVTDRDRANADAPLSLDIDASKVLTEQILIARELQVASLLFATASFSNQASAAAAGQWSLDTTASDPLIFANTASNVLVRTSGLRPNRVAMGYNPFLSLKRHQSVSDRIKYTERSIVSEELIASLFDVDKVLIGMAAYDAGQEIQGGASINESMTYMWGQSALWMWVPPSPSLRSPATSYMFANKGTELLVKKYRDDAREGDWIEVSSQFDIRVVASLTGFFLSGISA